MNVLGNKSGLSQEREKLERDQAEAIAKAVNSIECAVKEKHIRSAIIGTWHERGATIFWQTLGKMPLPSQVIMSWKAMLVVHKLLREGHPNAMKESFKYRQLLKDMSDFWKHSPKKGYGRLVHFYLKAIIAKLDFHEKNTSVPGALHNSDGEPFKLYSTDINDHFQLSVEIFDYLDNLIELEKAIFTTLDPFRSSSQMQAVQCRICPFPVLIQECSGLYQVSLDLMHKLHARLPEDTLSGHRERFTYHYKELKRFFFDAGNMSYVRALVNVPVLPETPPSFLGPHRLNRSSSFDAPKRVKLKPAEEPKRRSLMEPLAYVQSEPPLQAAMPTTESDLLGMSTDGPPPDNRDVMISQLKQEIASLRLELQREKERSAAMENSLRGQISRLEEELLEYKSIAEKTCEENVALRDELEGKDEDKKGSKAQPDEKFNKLKTMYSKLREEHIQLLRGNAEVKQKLNAATKAQEEGDQAMRSLQHELEDKDSELLQVYQKVEMAEQGKRVAEETVEQLTKDKEEKDSVLTTQLQAAAKAAEDVEREKQEKESRVQELQGEMAQKLAALNSQLAEITLNRDEVDQLRRDSEETSEKERKDKEQQLSALNIQLSELRKAKEETDDSKKAAEEAFEKERKEHEEKLAASNSELAALSKTREELEEAKKLAEENTEKERREHQDKISELEKRQAEEDLKDKHDFVVSSIEEAEKTIQETLVQFHNPKHSATTCTAEYLLSRVESLPDVIDQLATKYRTYMSNHKEACPFVCCVSSFSHQLSETILNAKATSHMAPSQEAEELQRSSESAGQTSLQLLALFKQQDADPGAVADKLAEVKRHIRDLNSVAESLAPKEQDNAETLGNAVEDEINNTQELVANAASRIQEMLNKAREKQSGVQLEVNGRILGSCTALMEAIKVLILKSKDLQQEVVEEGKGSATDREFYKRHHRWTEGLISAAKAVGWGAKVLVDSADKVLEGEGKFEEIVVSSKEIAASTAQLVAASRVKAKQGSPKLSALQTASKSVAESTAAVVASAKTGAEMIEDSETVPDYSKLTLTQARRYEMDSQVRVLELESQLTKERDRLGKLRRAHYQLAGMEEGQDS